MATLQLTGIRKEYGQTVALDSLDLDIRDGEFFVLLGPSGAGKTTTLKTVAGLEEPTAGTVRIGGRDMAGVEPNHRHLAMAFENYALYPQMTNYDNIAFPLRSPRYKVPEAEARGRIERVTETLGIRHLLGRLPAELSGGQRQRVALARVLVRPADVLLLDEPLSHLDAKLRATMRAELKSLGEMERTTSVYVTHDYLEALALGDRIAVLDRGQLRQVGTREQIWNQPVDTFVARAFGQPEINLIEGEVVQDDGLSFRSTDGAIGVPLPGWDVAPGTAVTLGLRPRDLRVAAMGHHPGRNEVELRGTVYVVEPLGRQIELTVQAGANQVIAVIDRSEIAVDAPVNLVADGQRLLLFDRASGRRIESSSPSTPETIVVAPERQPLEVGHA